MLIVWLLSAGVNIYLSPCFEVFLCTGACMCACVRACVCLFFVSPSSLSLHRRWNSRSDTYLDVSVNLCGADN